MNMWWGAGEGEGEREGERERVSLASAWTIRSALATMRGMASPSSLLAHRVSPPPDLARDDHSFVALEAWESWTETRRRARLAARAGEGEIVRTIARDARQLEGEVGAAARSGRVEVVPARPGTPDRD